MGNRDSCFLESLDSERFAAISGNLRRYCKILQVMVSGSEFHTGYVNLEKDSRLSKGLKFGVAKALSDADSGSEQDLREAIKSYCRNHQCKGSAFEHHEDYRFGHVMPRAKFELQLKSAGNSKTANTKTGGATSQSVDKLLASKLSMQRLKLRSVPLSKWLMWAFYSNESPRDPLGDLDLRGSELRRRLGLGHFDPSEEFLYCAYDLGPNMHPHVPTVLDAEFSTFFRVGGRTLPLDGGDDGLPEVVHTPVTGGSLSHPVSPAIS